MKKRFALLGVAGYVAPRHLEAIARTGHELVAAMDPHDAVGILDSYFPQAAFFTEFERFDRHLDKLRRQGKGIHYLSVCSPNYLHDAHVRYGLRLGADVICEKPLVLNPWNVESLQEMERETGKRVCTILQLRMHPALRALREKLRRERDRVMHEVELTYITSRGKWYYASWKGDLAKSGGIATNIGIHFFDMLGWLFGAVRRSTVHLHTHDRAAGLLELERARVHWFLSIDPDTLPEAARSAGLRSYRSITVDGEAIEFSGGFADLHTRSYEAILDGQGFGTEEAAAAIRIAYDIRNARPVGLQGSYHKFAALPLKAHPFRRKPST